MIISNKEYELLCELKKNPEKGLEYEMTDFDVLRSIAKDKMIEYYITEADPNAYSGYYVLPKGDRAIAEYELEHKKDVREDGLYKTAKDANRLSKWAIGISFITVAATIIFELIFHLNQ